MKTGDEFGYSPDIGKFVTRDGKTYTENGSVLESTAFFRSMPCRARSHENYADWTDEERARKREAAQRRAEELSQQEGAQRATRLALVERARGKLTEDEFLAVVCAAREGEC